MTDSDSDSPSTSPVRIPTVRGMLLARTHFEVLGFDGGSLRPRDVSDEEVRSAYRRCARAVRASRDLGSAVAECRVEEAYAALRTPETREETWRATAAPSVLDGPVGADADAGERARRAASLGRLRTTKNDAPGLARVPWTVDFPVENSVAVGPVDKRALVAARRRVNGADGAKDALLSDAAERRTTPLSNHVSSALAFLRDEREFFVRECGFPGTKTKLCAFWVGGTPGSVQDPLSLRYQWRPIKSNQTVRNTPKVVKRDGEWFIGRGDVVRVVRTRPKTKTSTKTSADGGVKLVAAEHVANAHVPGWILTERAEGTGNELLCANAKGKPSLDLWAANLRALLTAYEKSESLAESLAPGTPPPAPRGKGGLRGTAPSPVRRHLVPY
jgi:hypothetical protein